MNVGLDRYFSCAFPHCGGEGVDGAGAAGHDGSACLMKGHVDSKGKGEDQ